MLRNHVWRLHTTLVRAGIPISGVSEERIDYADNATAEQISTGNAIFEVFDWSDEAHDLWELEEKRRQVDEIIQSSNDPLVAVLWGIVFEVHDSIITTRNKVNEIISLLNLNAEPLINRNLNDIVLMVAEKAKQRI